LAFEISFMNFRVNTRAMVLVPSRRQLVQAFRSIDFQPGADKSLPAFGCEAATKPGKKLLSFKPMMGQRVINRRPILNKFGKSRIAHPRQDGSSFPISS
jgi:hypothetical protein